MTFYLGTHMPNFLGQTAAPLFVSYRRLRARRSFPRAAGPWALDSGGFTELQMFGRWAVEPARYADDVRRIAAEVGGMEWAAPQDWMCEPVVIAGGVTPQGVRFAGTGLSVPEHQRRTVANFLQLRELAPELPWVPVLQGYALAEYVGHARQYEAAGVDLPSLPRVGVGSVCRRQATNEGVEILAEVAAMGIKAHGFGLKKGFLRLAAGRLASCDSLAWSDGARRRRVRLDGCEHSTCANCLRYALAWRDEVLALAARPAQALLF